jgi:hypothetical protein
VEGGVVLVSEPETGTARIIDEIAHERAVQRGRWGDEFDDANSDAWWGNMLGAYLGRVQSEVFTRGEKPTEEAALRYVSEGDEILRQSLVKVATIAVAYVEALDRRAEQVQS